MTDPLSPQGAEFVPVSTALIKVRVIATIIWTAIPIIAFAVLGFFTTKLLWIGSGVFLLLAVWLLWLIPRQVRAMGYAETDDHFLIRKGVMFRGLTLVPYGRIQYVDISEGPIARHFGISSITLHTASTETSGSLDGLPAEEAVRLRELLAQRDSSSMAGL